jgi:hypothetical protein
MVGHRLLGQPCPACDHAERHKRNEGDGVDDWISGAEAATILGVSRTEVWRSLDDEDRRARWWGQRGVGWRYRPLSERRIVEVSRARAEALAAGAPQFPGQGDTPDSP